MPLIDSDNPLERDPNTIKYCEENWSDSCRKRKPKKQEN